MLTRFRSAASPRPKYLAASLFVGVFLAGTLFAFVPTSSARMEDPQPMPEFEGWPDPYDDSVTDGTADDAVLIRQPPLRQEPIAPATTNVRRLGSTNAEPWALKTQLFYLHLVSWMRYR